MGRGCAFLWSALATPVLTRCLLLVAVLGLTASDSASAQPSAEAVVEAWADGWDRAWGRTSSVVLTERAEQSVDGPRRDLRIETEGTLTLSPGRRPERRINETRVNGRRAETERGPRGRDRLRRAFGPPGREVLAPARLPVDWLPGAEPVRLVEDRLDGRAAWRVDMRSPAFDDLSVWFSRSESDPELLGVRGEGARPGGGRVVRDIRYARADGLDLPRLSETTFTGRQRRRLRDYVVTLRAESRYIVREVR